MTTNTYLIRQCKNIDCDFRYPAPKNSGIGLNCPKCKSETSIIHELELDREIIDDHGFINSNNSLEVALDNIRSTFNVGSIFRTADGVGIHKIHLCGITPPPSNLKVQKTSLGAEKNVAYEIHPNSVVFVKSLKDSGYQIIGLEKTNSSRPIFDLEFNNFSSPVLLIVGNEITGIDPDVLELCDYQIHLPMLGLKKSYNVAIAFSIAAYILLESNFESISN